MSNTPEQLEHIEHDRHAAHSRFDRNVAMTMAIQAAGLEALTRFGHRAHNETLQLQIQAGMKKTEAADQWAFYQAKNIREHEYEAFLALDSAIAKDPYLEKDPQRKA